MKLPTLLLVSLAAAGLALSARADLLNLDISADIRIGRAAPPPPPEVIIVERVGPPEPPPWSAPPHQHQRVYAYYYYPGSDVYYRTDSHTWYYIEGRDWRSADRLPDYVRVDFGRAVQLQLDNDRPYVYHQKVVAYYPPDYFTRVKFKNGHDNRPDDHGKKNNPGHDDHGKGKSKDKKH